mgnify:CR=1 FL=1
MENVNCLRCRFRHEDNGNCTAVGGFCTAVTAAHCPLLREYLDTGMTPEAFQSYVVFLQDLIGDQKASEALDRFRQLAKADKAGRLVVLPCKTRQEKLLEQYPTADVNENGILEVCPALLFSSHRGKKGGCSTPSRSCDDCRKEFWGLWAEAALEAMKDE